MHKGIIYAPAEERELSNVYAEILANLKLTPSELKKRVDYYQEREKLLTQQSEELEGEDKRAGQRNSGAHTCGKSACEK